MGTGERLSDAQPQPLFLNGTEARRMLGLGRDKFRRLARDGVIPSWTDPETNHRHYSRLALEAWALRNGDAA